MLAGLRVRDERAWLRLVRLFGRPLYGVCRSRGFGPEDARDIVQDVFLAVAAYLDQFHRSECGGSFHAWFWTIARSKMADHCRRRRHEPVPVGGSEAWARLQQLVTDSPDADQLMERLAVRLVLDRLVDAVRGELDELTWECFRRMVQGRQTAAEIAEQLNRERSPRPPLTAASVRQRKCRFLRRLREESRTLGLPVLEG